MPGSSFAPLFHINFKSNRATTWLECSGESGNVLNSFTLDASIKFCSLFPELFNVSGIVSTFSNSSWRVFVYSPWKLLIVED